MSGWKVDTLKEHFEALLVARDAALRLQASEYERRLNDLNHAHEQAVEVQQTYVTQDKYEDAIKAEGLARELALERQDARLKSLENWRSKAAGVAIVVTLFAGLAGAAVVKALGV